MAASKTFIVLRSDGSPQEIKAERAEQAEDSTRVTFYLGKDAIASFINIQGWFQKA